MGKELDKNGNSKSIKLQLERYKSIASNIEKAIGENKDTIICKDDNFDDLEGVNTQIDIMQQMDYKHYLI